MNISLNGSSHAFLFRRSEELDTQLFPKRVSFKTHVTTVKEVEQKNLVSWLSTLHIFRVITRVIFSATERATMSLFNLATITFLKEKRGSYGSYYVWGHISGSMSRLFSVGLLAAHFTLNIFRVTGDGYHIAFVWAPAAIMLSSFAVPWFKYEYLEHRVVNWNEVKCVLSDIHYVCLFSLASQGSCCAIQMYWQFWYISELSGSPTIMGVAGLIRRPLVAVWFYLSGHLIERVGDLKTIAVSLFLFSVSFLAISFINIPWLVLVVHILQAAGYAFSYTGLNTIFQSLDVKRARP